VVFSALAWCRLGALGDAMAQMFCTQCGQIGEPQKKTKGSVMIEIVLWLFICLPGFIYSLWRMTTKFFACRTCGGIALVPPNSPVAQQMLAMRGQGGAPRS
jgi:hypothetical protein